MRRICIINQKGGVGKTTTTANLGALLAKCGMRVLLVDMDPQGHLTMHFGIDLVDGQPDIYDLLTNGTAFDKVAIPAPDGITLIPANVDLAAAEAELVGVTGREVILREALSGIDDRFDVMLIDCAPALGVLTINALVAAEEVIVPLQAHFFALQGLGKLLDTVTLVRQRINPKLTVSGVALCMHESSTKLAAEVVEDIDRFLLAARGSKCAWADAKVFSTPIRRNIKLAESSSYGKTVFDYAPKSNGAIDYARLGAEIFGLDVIRALAVAEGVSNSPAIAPPASAPAVVARPPKLAAAPTNSKTKPAPAAAPPSREQVEAVCMGVRHPICAEVGNPGMGVPRSKKQDRGNQGTVRRAAQ